MSYVTRDEYVMLLDMVQTEKERNDQLVHEGLRMAEMLEYLSGQVQKLAKGESDLADALRTTDQNIQHLFRDGKAMYELYQELVGINNPQKDRPQ